MFLMSLFLISNLSASCFQLQESKYCNDYGPYTGINSGLVFLDINAKKSHASFKPGYYFNGFFGYKFPNLKIEGEIGYQRAEVDHFTNCLKAHIRKASGHVESWLCMVNSIYEFNFKIPLEPYLGIGVGYGYSNGFWKSEEDIYGWFYRGPINIDYQKSGFAWQPIIGLNYKIFENFKAGIDYRFTRIDNDVKTHKLGFIFTGLF